MHSKNTMHSLTILFSTLHRFLSVTFCASATKTPTTRDFTRNAAFGLLASSCDQGKAQNSQPGSQSPMNHLPIEPAPNPEDAKRQLPSVNTDPLPGFPPPANPAADIGEQVAAEKALKIAAKDFKAINSKVIKSSLMSYKEARQQLSEPIEEDDPLFNTPVRVLEIAGTFKRRNHRLSQEEVPISTPTFTKGYIIFRAADGLLLVTQLVK